ncbi:MAG: hypothetical protein J6V66_05945 [Clostridia bacterium]|nr:hypothetical protein [Clostridia bacterium]
MRTREESLNKFIELVDELIGSNYLFANPKIFEVITAINSSKLLSDTFNYFTDGYDFQSALISSFMQNGEDKYFVLPERNTDVLAFVYSLLREINFKNLQLTDLLDYFDAHKNYDAAYANFANTVILPFKSYVYQIGMQMINSTQTQEEALVSKKVVEEEPLGYSDIKFVEEAAQRVAGYENSLATLVRLLDLERLSVKDSRLSQSDVTELMYILDIFEEKVREKEKEKIKLIYLAYLYAIRPFKKLKSNIKRITEVLMEEKVI